MTEKVNTDIGYYLVLPDFKSCGHPRLNDSRLVWGTVHIRRSGPLWRIYDFADFCILASHKQFGSIQNRVLHILALYFSKTKMPDVSELKRQLHILKLITGSELKMVDEEPVKMFLSKNGIDKKGTKYQVRRECLERFKIIGHRTGSPDGTGLRCPEIFCTRRDSIISGFLGPPSASAQGLCGFNRGRSLVVKSRVKSLATPAMSE